MNEAEIDRLVQEAVAKRQIDARLTARSTLDAVTRHPLTLTVLAFFLTTVLGTLLNNSVQARADARAHYSERILHAENTRLQAQDDVVEMLTQIYERAAMTDLLRSALRRQMAHEIEERKRSYDAVYHDWQTAIPVLHYRLRGFDRGDGQISYADRFNAEFITPFGAIDACITLAFDVDRTLSTDHQLRSQHLVSSCPAVTQEHYQAISEQGRSIAKLVQEWLRIEVIALRQDAAEFQRDLLGRIDDMHRAELANAAGNFTLAAGGGA